MSIYAIGDLHLSGLPPTKPMEIFGEQWQDHRRKLFTAWQNLVTPEDLVILCGDTSWAMRLQEALPDLQALASLPGRKVLLRGNHDYWWASLAKMHKATVDQFFFLQNNYYLWQDTAICGTRGWLLASCEGFTPADKPILHREVLRLEASLQAAIKDGCQKIIVALHYPPFYAAGASSPFRNLLERYQVHTCVFGHIHGQEAASSIFQGEEGGVNYRLVSCDTINFTPVRLGTP